MDFACCLPFASAVVAPGGFGLRSKSSWMNGILASTYFHTTIQPSDSVKSTIHTAPDKYAAVTSSSDPMGDNFFLPCVSGIGGVLAVTTENLPLYSDLSLYSKFDRAHAYLVARYDPIREPENATKMSSMISWFVDVSTWDVASSEWNQALQSLPESEQQRVQRFVFAKDQKLALASRLLQRHLIHSQFHVPCEDIIILRTPEGKPYWQRPSSGVSVPSAWNYNVSHHGTVVAIAAHPTALVGVDVVQLSERPKRRAVLSPAAEFFRAFTDHFTANEWRYITKSSDETAQFQAFYRLWSLKESYIKAVGIGLGFTLLRAEFSPLDDAEVDWQMKLDGEIASKWRFQSLQATSQSVTEPHLISVALGPPSEMWKPEINSLGMPLDALGAYEAVEIPRDLNWQQKTLAEIMRP